jgi:hypothetical protein
VDLTKTTKTELELIDKLLSGHNQSLEILIPEDLDPKKAVKWSKAAASLMDKKDGEVAVLLQCMARLHYLARTNPEILKEADCESIAEYEDKVLRCKQHRSTIWKFSRAYKAFPSLTPDQAAEIGTENLDRAAKVATSVGASDAQKATILEKAKTLTVDKFKVFIEEESGLSGKGETTSASLTLTGSKAEIDEIKGHFLNPRFIIHAGTDHPIGMLLNVIHESEPGWPHEEDEPKSVQVGQTEEPQAEPVMAAASEESEDW